MTRIYRHSALRLRLYIVIICSVIAVSVMAMGFEYHYQYRVYLNEIQAALEEQARVLQLAQARLSDPTEFAAYVNALCAQMNEYISPGHHILVLDPNGNVLARSRQHSGEDVERTLLAHPETRSVQRLGDQRLTQVRLRTLDGSTIVLAQFLDHMESSLSGQLIRRCISTMVTAFVIIACIWLAVDCWVLRPLADLILPVKQWAAKDFSARAALTGPADFHILANEFNVMADRLSDYESQRMTELAQATVIQNNLLPKIPHKIQGLKISAQYRPAAHVAGDLYDVFSLAGEKTAIAILDVCGHGISAALLTGVVKMALHRRLIETDDLTDALHRINGDLSACIPDGYFVTACIGVWDPSDRSWTYCGAGHPGGILLMEDGPRSVPSTGSLLGMPSIGDFPTNRLHLAAGQRLFLYTDGLVDVDIEKGKFGVKRLAALIAKTRTMDLDQQTSHVLAHVTQSSRHALKDDITIVALQVK